MKTTVLLMWFALAGSWAEGATLPMPEEIQNIRLGMTLKELLIARPAVENQLAADSEWSRSRKSGVIAENLPNTSRFRTAIYILDEGRLAGISLYLAKKPQQLPSQRGELYRNCLARWGVVSKKEVGVLEPKSKKPKKNVPVAVWQKPQADVYLFAPETSDIKESGGILMLIAASAKGKLKPGFKADAVRSVEKERVFRAAGLIDE